ncbi:hypothetical protein WKW50_25050 [Ochrobactrum sp. GPK 3]
MKNKNLLRTLIFLSTVFQVCNSYAQEPTKPDVASYIDYFNKAVFQQTQNGVPYVFRWNTELGVCQFGNYSSTDDQAMRGFIKFLNSSTILNLTVFDKNDIKNCSNDDTIFLRWHDGKDGGKNVISNDILFLGDLTGRYLNIPAEKFNMKGMGLYSFGSYYRPYMYVSLSGVGRGNIDPDIQRTTEIVQKPLYGALTGIQNEFSRKYDTFLSDPLFSLSDQFKIKYSDRRINLCRFDVITLLVLYGKKQSGVPTKMPMDYYKKFIETNYHELLKESDSLMNNPNYSHIFLRKC